MSLEHERDTRRTTDRDQLAMARAGSGERLVFVHGFSQTGRSWAPIADAFASCYETVCLDLPGHGGSAEVLVADIDDGAELVGARGGHACYIGYSLGGRTCLGLALTRPELVSHLVLIGATPGIEDDEERAARRRADGRLADRLDPPDGGAGLGLQPFLDEWLAGPLFAHLSPAQANVDSRLANTPRGLAQSLRTMGTGTQRPSHRVLANLAMPVLLVAGANDAKFAAIAAEMASAIGSNATRALVDGAGHAAPFEQPAAFIQIVTDWLKTTA